MPKNSGKKYEDLIKLPCEEQGVDYTRLKDAGWQGEQTQRRFTSRNICDCILFYRGNLFFVEAKKRAGSLRLDEITQKDDLMKKWNPGSGVFSGVICNLKGVDVFVCTPDLDKIKGNTNKKSFNFKDALAYGYEVARVVPAGKRTPRLVMHELITRVAINETT